MKLLIICLTIYNIFLLNACNDPVSDEPKELDWELVAEYPATVKHTVDITYRDGALYVGTYSNGSSANVPDIWKYPLSDENPKWVSASEGLPLVKDGGFANSVGPFFDYQGNLMVSTLGNFFYLDENTQKWEILGDSYSQWGGFDDFYEVNGRYFSRSLYAHYLDTTKSQEKGGYWEVIPSVYDSYPEFFTMDTCGGNVYYMHPGAGISKFNFDTDSLDTFTDKAPYLSKCINGAFWLIYWDSIEILNPQNNSISTFSKGNYPFMKAGVQEVSSHEYNGKLILTGDYECLTIDLETGISEEYNIPKSRFAGRSQIVGEHLYLSASSGLYRIPLESFF